VDEELDHARFSEVLERVLDKGIVIEIPESETTAAISLVGIPLIGVEADVEVTFLQPVEDESALSRAA
jgi:hypothetical protein